MNATETAAVMVLKTALDNDALQASLDDMAQVVGTQRQTISELREALKDIGGGHVPGMSDLVLAHDWHAVVNLFQRKARAALKATGEA